MTTAAYRLLLDSLRIRGSQEVSAPAKTSALKGAADYELLYKLAAYHTVRPQLLDYLLRDYHGEPLAAEFMSGLQDSCRDNLVEQIEKVSEFFRFRESLTAHSVTAVPFKGFWLAVKYYGNLAARESSDTDIFIRYSDLGLAGDSMTRSGYRVGAPFLDRPDASDCEYAYGLYSGGRCTSYVEFHWRMAPAGFGLGITLDDLSSQLITSEIEGRPVEGFSPAATLLLTVMHHGGKDAFAKLKQVYDIAMILSSGYETDSEWLLSEAKRHGCLTLLALSVRLASDLTGAEVPWWLKELCMTDRIRRLAEERALRLADPPAERRRFRGQVNDWIFRIRSRDGFMVRTGLGWRFVRKVLLPALVPKKLHPLFMRKYNIPDYAREV
ncbi:MAG TPA: nucleotidyltransferase family protein [Bacteroidales bacterium]|nr:nucleotidyltransferase family protein [Bacteroidales bacterium]